MEKAYICNIVQENGIFKFITSSTLEFSKYYNVIQCSQDNMNTIEDVMLNIMDEVPEIVFLYFNKENWQLVLTIVKALIKDGMDKIILVCSNQNLIGKTNILNKEIKVINQIEDINNENLSNNINLNLITDEILTLDESYKTTMLNGLNMYLTGNYFDQNYITNMKHLEFQPDVTIPIDKLSLELMNINSAFIFDVKKSDLNLYKKIKFNIDNPVFSHVHQISSSTFTIDSDINEVKLKIVNYANYKSNENILTYLKISNKKDIERFIKDLDYFKKEGKFKYFSKVINSCMWTTSGCSLSKLPRGNVDVHLNLQPCIGCSKSIGTITDEYFLLLKNASSFANKVKASRNCSACEANNYCAKCAMLPDDISETLYCKIVKEYPFVNEYFYKLNLFSEMFHLNKLFEGSYLYELENSNMYNNLVFDHEFKNVEKSHNLLTAFKFRDKFYLISYKKLKIIHTEERFIYISEAYAKNYTFSEICKLYANKFKLPLKESEAQVKEALILIKEEKVVV